MSDPVLQVSDLGVSFGGIVAVDKVSLTINRSEVVGVIGANGAGKTTFVNMVTGWIRPSSGTIVVNGRNVAGLPPRAMARHGVTRSFQVPQVFTSLTTLENIVLAYGLAENPALRLFSALSTPHRMSIAQATLQRFALNRWAEHRVSELPQGARKLLDIAMALARKPELLLLDEPTSGVAREEKFSLMEQVFDAIGDTRVTILFVEHDMDVVTRYASRVVAFVQGQVVADGDCRSVLANKAVQEHIVGSTAPVAAPV